MVQKIYSRERDKWYDFKVSRDGEINLVSK